MIPTTQVTWNGFEQHGQAAVGARIQVRLNRTDVDVDHGQILPSTQRHVADENGAAVFGLWPNQRGTESSQYDVTILSGDGGRRLLQATITVPEVASVDLIEIIAMPPFPPVDAAQQAVEQAQAAAADAIVAKDEAEAAALAASNSAGDADTSAQAAQDAATAAGNAQTAAETAQSAAETAQGLSESARDDSQDARDAAQLAQTAAETARDAAQSAQTAAETARDAAQAAQSDSETARDLSQAWATGTEPDGPGTKSSREHAEDSAASAAAAEGFKDDAEEAADRIPDPAGQPNGRSITAVDGAWVTAQHPPGFFDAPPGQPYVWDDFQRDASATLGTSRSGNDWLQLGTFPRFELAVDAGRNISGMARPPSDGENHDVIDLGTTNVDDVGIHCRAIVQPSRRSNGGTSGVVIAQDDDNWIRAVVTSDGLTVTESIDGVESAIGSNNVSTGIGVLTRNLLRINLSLYPGHVYASIDVSGSTGTNHRSVRESTQLAPSPCRYVGIYSSSRFWGVNNFLGFRNIGWGA